MIGLKDEIEYTDQPQLLLSAIEADGQSHPRIASSADGDFSIVSEAYPFLNAKDMENMGLIYDLNEFDALDLRATSYFDLEQDDNIIGDIYEVMRHLNDTKPSKFHRTRKLNSLIKLR